MNRYLLIGLVTLASHRDAQAQVTPFGPRPPADSIVAAVLDAEYVGSWADHVSFQGCPQSDPVGQGLIIGFDPDILTEWLIGELADLWTPELATCNHAPLLEWYREAIHRMVDLEGASWSRLLYALPPNLSDAFSEDLTAIATDSSNPDWLREEALVTVSRLSSTGDRLAYFFEHVGEPGVSERWVLFEAFKLYGDLGPTYINGLTSEVSGLGDAAVNAAATPIWSAIRDSTLAADDPSVAAFLASIEGRDGLQLLNSAITGEPISGGTASWALGTSYAVGDEVSHLGLDYRCRQAHTALSGWEPPATYALWERINTGGEWAPQVIYQTNDEAIYLGATYRALQGHQSQPGWEPPNQPALWTLVN